MKTLYVSDLDGTLLNENQRTSEYTNQVINRLLDNGIIFSYATARAFETASAVTKGLDNKYPVILHNGSYILDTKTGEIILSNFFENTKEIICDLTRAGIYPIVFSRDDFREQFSFISEHSNKGVLRFAEERIQDKRYHAVSSFDELDYNTVFYITCIDSDKKLKPFYEKYKNEFHCEYQINLYTKEQWLEIMPRSATKANAVLQLKKQMNCDRIVCFGDESNDIDMFNISDECYAVMNAVDELKKIATAVIESNKDDGVAKWLEKNVRI